MSRAFALGVGALAGGLSGLLGIGGGLVVGPALALGGMPLPHALGTALVVVGPVATVGVLAEIASAPHHLHWLAALLVAAGGQLGAPLGARLIVRLPERELRWVFCLFLVFVGLRNLGAFGPLADPPPSGAEAPSLLASCLALASGVAAGVSASLFGIGGGVVVVPALIHVVGGFDFHSAAATSLLAMIPTAVRGAWIADRQGRVRRKAAAELVPAAVLTAAGAVWIRNSALDHDLLTRLFGAFFLLVAIRLLTVRR